MRTAIALVYVIIGVFVAGQQGYLLFNTFPNALSAAVAILLWPLLFFGVNLHFGGAAATPAP